MARVGDLLEARALPVGAKLATDSQDITWVEDMIGVDLSDYSSVLYVCVNEDWLEEVWAAFTPVPKIYTKFVCVWVRHEEEEEEEE